MTLVHQGSELWNVPPLKCLPAVMRADIQAQVRAFSVLPRRILAEQGAEISGIMCIRQGILLLTRLDGVGNESPIELCHAGDCVAIEDVVAGNRFHSSTIVAVSKTDILSIPRKIFLSAMQIDPSFAARIAQRMARSALAAQRRMSMLSRSVKQRLLMLLVELKGPLGRSLPDGTIVVDLPIPRNLMATLIGTAPETLSRVTRELEIARVVQFNRTSAVIRDLDDILDIIEADMPRSTRMKKAEPVLLVEEPALRPARHPAASGRDDPAHEPEIMEVPCLTSRR